MAAPLPDRATLDAARQRAEEERAFWSAHRPELTRAYPDEFVAVQNGKVIDHDRDLMELALRLQRAGLRANEVSTSFMATQPECYLL